MHNTEDKQWWVIEWRRKETLFVEQVCPHLNLSAQINPAKRTDPYAPDVLVQGQLADLKCQQTPFFKAGVLFGVNPQFAITFNRKDFLRYDKLYPNLIIYYWLHWQETAKTVRDQVFRVRPMAGVWRVAFPTLREMIEQGKPPLHSYQRRAQDTQGNAKDSYVFDVRRFECLAQVFK